MLIVWSHSRRFGIRWGKTGKKGKSEIISARPNPLAGSILVLGSWEGRRSWSGVPRLYVKISRFENWNRYFYPNLRLPAIDRTLPAIRSGVLQDSTPYLMNLRRYLAIPAACEPPGD